MRYRPTMLFLLAALMTGCTCPCTIDNTPNSENACRDACFSEYEFRSCNQWEWRANYSTVINMTTNRSYEHMTSCLCFLENCSDGVTRVQWHEGSDVI